MMLKRREKLSILAFALLVVFAVAPVSNAMHIMEGYLPVTHCVLWMVVCLPFLVLGLENIKKVLRDDRRTLMVLALTGAFVFVLSSLKIPSVTGSCSHMTGTGLGAILFGPCRDEYPRRDRSFIPGGSAGARRADDAGSQLLFHGDRRTDPRLRGVQALLQDERQ